MKLLDGRELVGYIKERQARTVRQLRGRKIVPSLKIFYDNEDPVIMKYISLKQAYGEDIDVKVEVQKIDESNAKAYLAEANEDDTINGIIVQLPLRRVDAEILEEIKPEKDVDGLNGGMPSATAEAINWLLGGYNIELGNKKIAIVGYGRLVGRPLADMWKKSGYDVQVFRHNDDLSKLKSFDLVVSATGAIGIIKSEMLKIGAIVVDAGTASENGVIKGDLDESVRLERQDLTLTPKIGGVGPLTVCLLFEHVLIEANKKSGE